MPLILDLIHRDHACHEMAGIMPYCRHYITKSAGSRHFRSGYLIFWLLTNNGWTVVTRFRPTDARVDHLYHIMKVRRPRQKASTYG